MQRMRCAAKVTDPQVIERRSSREPEPSLPAKREAEGARSGRGARLLLPARSLLVCSRYTQKLQLIYE